MLTEEVRNHMKNTQKAFYIVLLSAVFFASCAVRFDARVFPDAAADVDLRVSLSPRTSTLIANLSGGGGNVLDAASLGRALKAAPGVRSVALRNTDTRSAVGTLSIADLSAFLAPGAAASTARASSAGPLVLFERNASGGRLSVSIDRPAMSAALTVLPPEIYDYLTALLAPAATGENLGRDEYLALVASLYGEGVSKEIAAARLSFAAELPAAVRSARGGKINGRTVEYELQLLDLLLLEKPILIDAAW
jgi:hypothetical protein